METQELKKLLEEIRAGQLDIDAALERMSLPPVAELEFAHVDRHRRDRCGFPEVIFCEGKTREWVVEVVHKLVEAHQDCLATRVNNDQAEYLAAQFPAGQQDRLARTFW